jgi:TonB family protein
MNSSFVLPCLFVSLGLLSPLACLGDQTPVPAKTGSGHSRVQMDEQVMLVDWCPPEYTPELKSACVEGKVSLIFIVNADDSIRDIEIQKSPDYRLNTIAVNTLKKWRFTHASENGVAIDCDMQTAIEFSLKKYDEKHVRFSPDLRPRPFASQAKGKLMPIPDRPEESESLGTRANVLFEVEVTKEGRAQNPKVITATHPAIVQSCLDYLLNKWEFEPARQGRVPRMDKVRIPMEYDCLLISRKELLDRNGVNGPGGVELSDGNGIPLLASCCQPVYPTEDLLAGRSGKAVLEFTVDPKGYVTDIIPIESTSPAFAGALEACVALWSFDPVISEGRGTSIKLRVTHVFTPPVAGDKTSPEARLIAELNSPEGILVATGGNLDAKLRPIYRFPPLNPSKVELTEKVEVVLNFVIDREGRVRLPRFDASQNAEFGWAAAQALTLWVFAPPMKGGKPVDVQVKLPFSFFR